MVINVEQLEDWLKSLEAEAVSRGTKIPEPSLTIPDLSAKIDPSGLKQV